MPDLNEAEKKKCPPGKDCGVKKEPPPFSIYKKTVPFFDSLFLPLRHQGTKKEEKYILCVLVPLWRSFFPVCPAQAYSFTNRICKSVLMCDMRPSS